MSLQSFGASVDIDGDKLVVGAPGDNMGQGAIYAYDLPTGTFINKITVATGAPGDALASSMAVSNGKVLAGSVTAPFIGLGNAGCAYLFDLATGQELAKLVPSDSAEDDAFGSSLDLVGNRALIGAFRADSPQFRSGAAYLFDASTGQQIEKLIQSTPGEKHYGGFAVAVTPSQAPVGLPRLPQRLRVQLPRQPDSKLRLGRSDLASARQPAHPAAHRIRFDPAGRDVELPGLDPRQRGRRRDVELHERLRGDLRVIPDSPGAGGYGYCA